MNRIENPYAPRRISKVHLNTGHLKCYDGVALEAGASADSVVAEAKHVDPKPPTLALRPAVALPIANATAWAAFVDKPKRRAGQLVFIAGCHGGVGNAGVQIALMRVAKVSGSCNSSKREEVLAPGFSKLVDYRNVDATRCNGCSGIVFDAAVALSMSQANAMLTRDGGT